MLELSEGCRLSIYGSSTIRKWIRSEGWNSTVTAISVLVRGLTLVRKISQHCTFPGTILLKAARFNGRRTLPQELAQFLPRDQKSLHPAWRNTQAFRSLQSSVCRLNMPTRFVIESSYEILFLLLSELSSDQTVLCDRLRQFPTDQVAN